MDRPKRPFFSLKTPEKGELKDEDQGPSRKLLKDKINVFEKTTVTSQDAGKFRKSIVYIIKHYISRTVIKIFYKHFDKRNT